MGPDPIGLVSLQEWGLEPAHTQRDDHTRTQGEDGCLQAQERGLGRKQPCPHRGPDAWLRMRGETFVSELTRLWTRKLTHRLPCAPGELTHFRERLGCWPRVPRRVGTLRPA